MSIALVSLVVAYVVFRPVLENWLGVELPSLVEETGQVVNQPLSRTVESRRDVEPGGEGTHSTPAGGSSRGNGTGKLGKLREIQNRVYVSTAGLRYRPGSQEGHRLDHVLKHATNDPTRPVHGVFDGDREEILAVIDEAYLITRERGPPEATCERQKERLVWTVDLGRRVGYIGGQSGDRKHRPSASHVKLVLENGNDVVSAYPVRVSER